MSDYFTAASTAFAGSRRLSSGSLVDAALAAKAAVDAGDPGPVLVFDDATGTVVEIDLRGTHAELVSWLAERARETPARLASANEPVPRRTALTLPSEERALRRGRGRPRLGVVAREVTLLPRHWEWLDSQPTSASQTLRRLVEEARRGDGGRTAQRGRIEAAYRFLTTTAGDHAGYENALRALFAGDRERFLECVDGWPRDVVDYAVRLAWAKPEARSPVHS